MPGVSASLGAQPKNLEPSSNIRPFSVPVSKQKQAYAAVRQVIPSQQVQAFVPTIFPNNKQPRPFVSTRFPNSKKPQNTNRNIFA